MKNKPQYSYLFEKTILDFIIKNKLLTPRVCCAVSGGLDSMVMAFVAAQLYSQGRIKHLSFLHVDHQTRAECEIEKKLVQKLAQNFQVEFISRSIFNLKLSDSNFELKAREARQQIYKDQASTIWCAHHLDDSFEWSLRQRFSSSAAPKYLGIPVRTPLVTRPMLTVTKKQISRYAIQNKIKWSEDSSNLDPKFEKGYLRTILIPAIAKRYPQYLKHYARASQSSRVQDEQTDTIELIKGEHIHHYLLKPESNINLKNIKKSIQKFSKIKQGKLANQLSKISGFIKNGKMGPLSFSGAVELYNLSNHLMIFSKAFLQEERQSKFKLESPKEYSYIEFRDFFRNSAQKSQIYSCWSAVSITHPITEYKGGHPLLPLSLRSKCSEAGLKLVPTWKLLENLRQKPQDRQKIILLGTY